MSNLKDLDSKKELQENDLEEVPGGASGDTISCGNYTVKECGVYTNGTKYVFVIEKSLNMGNGMCVYTLHRESNGEVFTKMATPGYEVIGNLYNSYQYVCISTEEKFKDAKKVSDL